ncbi:hypothetical protein B566_EDAN013354 [Ephemera danica]|nr:hypothetical protein B566_EDAN013354 [Ephemera danica]
MNFNGKRIMVTGAGKGIGRATVRKLVSLGAEVVAVSRTQADLDVLKSESPDKVVTICVDLADWDATRAALKVAAPGCHGLVNNAAIARLEPFMSVSQSNFDDSFAVNVRTVVNVSQLVTEDMISRKHGGSIVNISSQASKAALADHAVYCATKGALDMLSRVMALELGKHQIRVNCVNPTVVMTDMGRLGWSDPAKAAPMLQRIPLGRFAEEQDVVDTILFMLSDSSAMITGTALPVDGGFLA